METPYLTQRLRICVSIYLSVFNNVMYVSCYFFPNYNNVKINVICKEANRFQHCVKDAVSWKQPLQGLRY
jgi:hypothetical protein